MTSNTILPQKAAYFTEKESFFYVDVRSVPEFEQEHAQGSYNIPLRHMGEKEMTQNKDFVSVFEANFAKDAKLILACKAGTRSKKAVEILANAGFTHLVDQRAGFVGVRDKFGQIAEPGWKTSGLPTATEPTFGHDYKTLFANADL